ncbi:hypothetical protein B0H14DRAFT_3867942 [Mycena olivaceomarginata]|nr:hypothetical protein B0H14DRAFT_3867942 [Mycena olivaceomarginata]
MTPQFPSPTSYYRFINPSTRPYFDWSNCRPSTPLLRWADGSYMRFPLAIEDRNSLTPIGTPRLTTDYHCACAADDGFSTLAQQEVDRKSPCISTARPAADDGFFTLAQQNEVRGKSPCVLHCERPADHRFFTLAQRRRVSRAASPLRAAADDGFFTIVQQRRAADNGFFTLAQQNWVSCPAFSTASTADHRFLTLTQQQEVSRPAFSTARALLTMASRSHNRT